MNFGIKKIKPDGIQLLSFGNVAGKYTRFFKNTGDIEYLKKAEQSLVKALEIANIGKAVYRRALARNYISQHRFKEALVLAEEADEIGGDRNATQSLLFDVHMDLGNYKVAEKYLDSVKNLSDFGYLIRVAKWNDYKGDLDTTINFMEKAKAKAESAKNKVLMLWSYTNLADYYGHVGRTQGSYTHYLKALELDDNNSYAKKAIAWIAFSHDKNQEEAMRISNFVTRTYKIPDYYLLKSEIAHYLNDELSRTKNLDNYFVVVRNPSYVDMYNGYNLGIFLDETRQYDNALALAKKEVANRPTPESYSWLAYSYLKKGNNAKAEEIIEKYVDGETFESVLLYQAAEVYKANGKLNRVGELKGELIGALYELGPDMKKQIQKL